ncbi:hypothetical protein E5F05_20820 [Deinococcus metallilatus]|uniref:Uncharacterized protein n=2 Tax=Deinococcus TaxID=1298 RepID=A0AAJ5JYS3_9DEIO|nr:hypothetical protein [Deinococcus metallilatus]MBB5294417.1 hypothetical protein [Deinococcus metallilatus]QBY10168.1 hypothetical protein E5F05_20820 [Deinococcus metallilatus]RXJ13894.1 hypothetical protein ERJ73_04470 [Deinococcus metallilatus]TLK29860.1 hypothetical protein FCS05_04785 [Deinococcus metallilatus]GMA15633.1 hypothetical protein GCM10025871_19640 [Deinococcus metallilatus]
MSPLTFEELVSYFFHAQAGEEQLYQPIDFVRLIEELGLENANALRHEIVEQLAGGRRLQVIQAELAA